MILITYHPSNIDVYFSYFTETAIVSYYVYLNEKGLPHGYKY